MQRSWEAYSRDRDVCHVPFIHLWGSRQRRHSISHGSQTEIVLSASLYIAVMAKSRFALKCERNLRSRSVSRSYCPAPLTEWAAGRIRFSGAVIPTRQTPHPEEFRRAHQKRSFRARGEAAAYWPDPPRRVTLGPNSTNVPRESMASKSWSKPTNDFRHRRRRTANFCSNPDCIERDL